uniref:Patatin n=1 Tax=Rhizophora mucronata TaxID=61149 RepID=A0A2P2MT62_RHIMU
MIRLYLRQRWHKGKRFFYLTETNRFVRPQYRKKLPSVQQMLVA